MYRDCVCVEVVAASLLVALQHTHHFSVVVSSGRKECCGSILTDRDRQ